MAFNPLPGVNSFFGAGYTATSTAISFTLDGQTPAALPLVTATEADDGSTGDWRKICYGIIEQIFQNYTNLPTADKPTKMTITRSASMGADGIQVINYNVQFKVAITASDVADEA